MDKEVTSGQRTGVDPGQMKDVNKDSEDQANVRAVFTEAHKILCRLTIPMHVTSLKNAVIYLQTAELWAVEAVIDKQPMAEKDDAKEE